MTGKHIEIIDLSFSYQTKKNNPTTVFDNFNLQLKAGQTTALMGQSGTGKTTLLLLIAGLLPIQSGSIEYPNNNPRFSMVFQENRLLEQADILGNLRLVNPALSSKTILDTMKQAGLDASYLNTKISQLSGGQQRRVAILRALLAEYDILLLDEPFTGLDDLTRMQMLALIKKMTAGKTVILVTHNLSDTEQLDCPVIDL